jgi:cytochrome c peroxidase
MSLRIVILALASYLRSLVTLDSPFDRYFYRKEDDVISDQAKEGLKLFIGKAGRSSCHQISSSFASFTDYSFHSIGIGFVDGRYLDRGRFEVSHDPSDEGAFKTPSLRNVALRAPYMHDGSMRSLLEVIQYYNRGAENLDRKIRPLGLSATEITELIAFLESLTSPVATYHPSEGTN